MISQAIIQVNPQILSTCNHCKILICKFRLSQEIFWPWETPEKLRATIYILRGLWHHILCFACCAKKKDNKLDKHTSILFEINCSMFFLPLMITYHLKLGKPDFNWFDQWIGWVINNTAPNTYKEPKSRNENSIHTSLNMVFMIFSRNLLSFFSDQLHHNPGLELWLLAGCGRCILWPRYQCKSW